jgi:hypothetical protein
MPGWLFVVTLGCGAHSRHVGDDVGDADADTDTDCGPPGESWTTIEPGADAADLLVLIDNSNSMREEQTNLSANLELALIGPLVEPPDDDLDGRADWRGIPDLHVGVITGDLGTAGYPVTTCDDSAVGDDGILQHLPSAAVAGCDPVYPPFLAWNVEEPDPSFVHDFECVATFGTGGCGFVQPVLAAHEALTVQSAPGAPNDGFLRAGAALAILFVTDGDDCSVEDPAIFGADESLGPLGLRCFNDAEMLVPWEDLVDSLLSLKRPDRLVVAGIVGVPPELVSYSDAVLSSADPQTEQDLEEVLDDPRMTQTLDYTAEGGGTRLVPACDIPGLGIASPARRLVQIIREIDVQNNGGFVQSICQADWRPVSEVIARSVERSFPSVCLPGPLLEDGRSLSTGEHADCVVRTVTESGGCGAASFRVGEEDGRVVCQTCQLGDGTPPFERDFRGGDVSACAGTGEGWSFTLDDVCGASGLIDFTAAASPPVDAVIRLECAASAMPPAPGC